MSENLGKDLINDVIDLLLSHSNRRVQDFLKSKQLPFSGDKDKLKERLISDIDQENISSDELIELLDAIEEYGNQQIYLFQVSETILEKLQDQDFVEEILEEKNLLELYNNYHPLLLPETPTIIYIEYDEDWFKIRWGVKKDDIGTPIEQNVVQENGKKYLIKKYLINEIREVTLFQVSLITGKAELLIHRSTNSDYEKEKIMYLDQIYSIFGWDPLDTIELNHAIDNLDNSGEVRTRNMGIETMLGSNINVGSPSKEESINEDPDADNARTVENGMTTLGHFYWLPDESSDVLKSELYTRIYSDRFSIYGERSEAEVNHVIQRIRHHIG
jgi:hypothetical protein